jgi:ubiquitin carboxyl-terminal hydrolase 10
VHCIADALLNLTQPEHLHGFTTGKSNNTHATKQILMEMLPPILILHLKRFVYDSKNNSTLKLCKFVEYDHVLEMHADMLSKVGQKNASRYELRGVIYHHGKMSTGGHYTCHVRLANGQWVEMDDTHLKVIDPSQVLKEKKDRQAYMLVYNQQK